MSKQVFQNSSFSSGLVIQGIPMQSILDVFVIQGLISNEDSESLKNRFRTNRELEKVLLDNRIVTRETINKAYSILLKIPYISFLNTKIEPEVLNIIPQKVAQRFGVVSFGINGNNLQIAVSRPSELNESFKDGMETLMANNHYTITMFITGPDDFNEAIKQYSGKGMETKLNLSRYPVVFLRNQNISKTLIQRLPIDFIKKHRAVIFDQRDDKNFSMAAERPDDSEVRRSIEYIQKQNNITIQLLATSKEDIDFIIDHYQGNPLEEKFDDVEESMENNQANNPEPNNINNVDGQDEEIISLSGIFSGLKSKKDDSPAITVDAIHSDENLQDPAFSQTNEIGKNQDEEKKTDDSRDELSQQLSEITPEEKKDEVHDPITIEGNSEEQSSSKNANNNQQDQEMEIGSLLESNIQNEEELRKILAEKYIPKVVAAIINYALYLRSSDVHVEAGAKDLRIRYRVDGILRDIAKLPLEMHPSIISRIKILGKMKIDETRIPQDGRFDVTFKHNQVDVRVSALPTVHGEKIVMRVLDKDQGVLSLEDLGMTGRAFELTIENIAKPYGVILSTGPTGSGKSTTLYAILNRISTPSVNIVTLEDPVEYEIPGVNQCQIKPAIGFTFAEGLRSVLRQDPNVVMVGEIRDGETAAMATHAALTGHLVLSTLHTNDASGALPRLTNMGIEPFLITSSINEIIAQRLVRRICPKCKEEMKVPQSLIETIKRELETMPKNNKRDLARLKPDFRFYHGVGCNECSNGYKGRVGIFEVLQMTEKVEALAIDKRSSNDIRNAATEDGMISMRHDGLLKCMEGITTIDEVYRATSG